MAWLCCMFVICKMSVKQAWEDVRYLCPDGQSFTKWKRTHPAIAAVASLMGYTLLTTEAELDAMEGRDAKSRNRKVALQKSGITLTTTIHKLLMGGLRVVTEADHAAVRAQISEQLKAQRPEGSLVSHRAETVASEALDSILGLLDYRVALLEFRLADVAYGSPEYNYVADQVKTAKERDGAVTFKHHGDLTVFDMRNILETGMSLTCIGVKDGQPSVVWFLWGCRALEALQHLKETQAFHIALRYQRNWHTPFIDTIQAFRYDLAEPEDVARLRADKLAFMQDGPKHSLAYLNEDISMIPSHNNWVEFLSFAATRSAVQEVGGTVEKLAEDNMSKTDFRVSQFVRVQDKTATPVPNNRFIFTMRPATGSPIPYHPNDFDILQISLVSKRLVYAIPMRVQDDRGQVSSFYTTEELGKGTVAISEKWKRVHAGFFYDFSKPERVQAYVQACEAAARVPLVQEPDEN